LSLAGKGLTQSRAENADKTEKSMLSLTLNLYSIFRKNDNIDSNASVLNHEYVMRAEFIKIVIIS
jgi:hypothetical protein